MAIYEWKKFLIPYEQAVEELKIKFKSIRREYREKKEYSPIEFVTGRVKEVSSILEKANKLNIPVDKIDEQMEDITGLRVMCQFVDDIVKVVEIIRNRKDMTIVYEKDYVTNVKESGYRSYHVILSYPVHMAEGVKYILAEIQIRTLAMNFWATIEHSLNYKYKQNLPEDLKKKLKSAADSAYSLDEQMLEIKDEIKDAQSLFEIKSFLVSDIIDNILTLASLSKVDEAVAFQDTLKRLINEGDINELVILKELTKASIKKYKQF